MLQSKENRLATSQKQRKKELGGQEIGRSVGQGNDIGGGQGKTFLKVEITCRILSIWDVSEENYKIHLLNQQF